MSNNSKRNQSKKKLTGEQQLEREIELLRVENAYIICQIKRDTLSFPAYLIKHSIGV